ncbi:MAG: DUF523 and DUF1722 domain-containing protein [Desulfurococcaceae archaeon]
MSSCLGVAPVRYDGNVVFDQNVEKLKKHVELFIVCPEMGIGLGTPRNPLALIKRPGGIRLVDTVKGSDYTDQLSSFSENLIKSLPEVDGILLKSSSPSCGVRDAKLYDQSRRVLGKRDGLFTAALREHFKYLPIESEKRLVNSEVRRDFYTKIFTIAYIREGLEISARSDDLVELHRSLKYLLMLYHPGVLKELGRMVARRSEADIEELKGEYRAKALKALSRRPSNNSYLSVFLHIYGHLKNKLAEEERRYVLKLLEDLKTGRSEVRALLVYFKGFIHRFGDAYLAEQRFLQPYPEELE